MATQASMTQVTETDSSLIRKKRVRASKPKVRTGCITCKVRRVKCDEQKPACVKCLSTGRTCDGYAVPVRHQQQAGDHSGSGNRIIPIINRVGSARPLLAGITGDYNERLYFHRFRQLAEDAVGIRHAHNALYWKRVVPQYCHEVDSVKHAYIAFSAAYHNFHVDGVQLDKNAPPSDIERFIIKQYNLAMKSLGGELQGMPVNRQYGVIMTCCVAFFCLEIFRNQWPAAMTHLANGLRLMSDLPKEVAGLFNDPQKGRQATDTAYGRVTYMLKLLSRWEVLVGLMVPDFRPHLTLGIYESRKLNAEVVLHLDSIESLHEAAEDICQDVNVFMWQTKSHRGDYTFWSQSQPSMQHCILQRRARQLTSLLEGYENEGDSENHNSRDYLPFHVSLLHLQSASLGLDMLLLPLVANQPLPSEELARYEEILHTAASIRKVLPKTSGPTTVQSFNADLGVVPMLHMAANNCRDPTTKERIQEMIQEWPQWKDMWDGPALKQIHMG